MSPSLIAVMIVGHTRLHEQTPDPTCPICQDRKCPDCGHKHKGGFCGEVCPQCLRREENADAR